MARPTSQKMSSSVKQADGSRANTEAIPPVIANKSNDLCDLCLRAVKINDQLAAGSTRVSTSSGTTTLDVSGFAQNDWIEVQRSGIQAERCFYSDPGEQRDARVWAPREGLNQPSRFCCGDTKERLVTLPTMPEISESVAGTCRLCSRLRELFYEQYAQSSWWNEPGSTLSFTIQYEWSEYRRVHSGGEMQSPSQGLDCLALLVALPDRPWQEVDVYRFDVVAWPGKPYYLRKPSCWRRRLMNEFMHEGPCQGWFNIKTTPLDPDGPLSDRNVSLMRRCIETCIHDHPECKTRSFNSMFVPKRLLDLGESRASPATLIECDENVFQNHPASQPRYATLSYCWGKSLSLTTTTMNKHKHETVGIDVHNMPATFQDAIFVAKKLGIRYLWIDALCIVQDDRDDWEVEAVKMCDVFAHSQVTISAARNSSSADSFLRRSPDELLSVQFHSTLEPDVLDQYFIRLEPRHYDPTGRELEQSTWASRAWVFQEVLMSTRQLIFGNKALQFRCGRGAFLEDGQHQCDTYKILTPSIDIWERYTIVYASRKLTYASDRLKAIAGVAEFIKKSNLADGKSTRYLVGLWENERLGGQLRWVHKQPSLSCTELMGLLQDKEPYIAPSWSWASRNSGIDCLSNGSHTAFRVVNTDLRASHKSAMVSVAFGSSITIIGKFRQTPVEPCSGRLEIESQRPCRWEASSAYGRTEFWLDWVPKGHDAEESEFERRLCLLLTTELDNIRGLGGLIVAPVQNSETGELFHYRVGTFAHMGDRNMLMNQPDREITIR